jgi:glycolate oxidase FAD binding subunit
VSASEAGVRRPAGAPYPFAATPPVRVERPADRAELARLVAGTTEAVVPTDGARERAVSAPLDARDWLAVDVTGLDRLVDWQPDDLTVTVESALPLSRLAEILAERDQWLPLETPDGSVATVGHVVAGALGGARATRFGGPRRQLIGLTVLDGRGTLTRAGGRLVKNVAGYDLMKLHAGAWESLGLLIEMTFRLRPLPETVARLEGRVPDAAAAARFAQDLSIAGFEPDLFRVTGGVERTDMDVELEFSGFSEDVREEAAAVETLDPAAAWRRSERAGRSVLEPAGSEPPGDRLDVDVFAARPHAGNVLEALAAWARERPAVGRRIEWHPFLDRFRLIGETSSGSAALGGDDLKTLRSALVPTGGRVRVGGRGPAPEPGSGTRPVAELLDGPPPAAIDLFRRLKAAYDPDRRLQPGRFHWGL